MPLILHPIHATWHLYSTHCQIPVTSQHNLSIVAAADILKALRNTVPTTTTEKIRHIRAIQNLTAIMTEQREAPEEPPSPRVVAPTARVVSAPPPMVTTTSNNITAPNVIRTMPLVHQRHTCNNNPFNILAHDDDNDDTVVASNCSTRVPQPSLPPSNLQGNPKERQPTLPLANPSTSLLPTLYTSCPPTTPPPRVLAIPTSIQAITPAAPHTCIHDLHPNPTRKPSKTPTVTKQPTHALTIVEPDDKRDEMPTKRPSAPPQCSTQLITNRTPCNISHQALYHIIGLGFINAPANTIPQLLSKYHKQYTGPLIDIKEYCYGVVHPVTKENITRYRKLIKDPLLKDLWIKAMSKELHRLAQGCPGVTKGTNTMCYLSHANICKIPQDRTVTYARTVIDHCPQKEDPNHVGKVGIRD
jgi:hypothetical protein